MASWEDVKRIGLGLPETEAGTWYGTAALMRLAATDEDLLREQLVESWLRKAPAKLATEHARRLDLD